MQKVGAEMVDMGWDGDKTVFSSKSDPSLPVVGVAIRRGPRHSLGQQDLDPPEQTGHIL